MYKVSIFNNGVETVIHADNTDNNAPHVLSLPHKESLSLPDGLSFVIPIQNPGYELIEGLITKVKVYDTRDNSVVFSGRVLPLKSSMDSSGKFTKEVTCEGALAYLNDTNTRRWTFTNQTPSQILTYILNQHNLKVDDSRKINLGTIEVTQPITVSTNYETSLNAIVSKIRNILGGDIGVRETDGLLYLDYLQAQGVNNNVEIRLGYNMKDITQEYDPADLVTRVVPIGYGEGINQLDITKVNDGMDYVEDATAKAKYGVIESVVTNKDIQEPNTLKVYGNTVLAEKKQPKLTISTNMLDLSVLAGHEGEKYSLGDTLHIINSVMNVDVLARVIERSRDLLNNPWNPTLTISTRPIRLTDQIVSLKQRSLTLENAPQGSTYIDTYGYAENIDATHSFQLPVWLSPDILNVNRVRLHIDSQQFRAYEKGMAAGGGNTATSSSGGAATPTSGASSKSTSDAGGNSILTSGLNQVSGSTNNYAEAPTDPNVNNYSTHTHNVIIDPYELIHSHQIDIPPHDHGMSHTHSVAIPAHNHTVDIPSHTHEINYGIFEDTFPKNVNVKVNGVVVAGPFATDGNGFSIDLDLTQYINTAGQTYNLEITSSQNGRINVWVSIQAFIQAK